MQASLASAVTDFRRARYRAAWEQIMARLSGRSNDLLSYEDVRKKLKAGSAIPRGLRDVPLDLIVGSVGRYGDFTRNFLPRKDSDEQRWARVKVATMDLTGLPPIELYQIGEVYFVLDGNHRVSVARELGVQTIQAYVQEIQTKIPLTADVKPDDIILKAEYLDFLEQTRLDQRRPEADLSVTAPGRYPLLLEHIEVHRYYMGLEWQREIDYYEAVEHWYDHIYLPIIQTIRQQGLLFDFPERTETDLYLWLSKHRGELAEELGWETSPEEAAADLAGQHGARPSNLVSRLGGLLLDAMTPEELEAGPPPGQWRRDRLDHRSDNVLFRDILAPVSDSDIGWVGLEQAAIIAEREGGRLRGLHLVETAAEQDSPAVRQMRDLFKWRVGEFHLEGDLAVEVGGIARKVVERSRWTDLVVIDMAHPPPNRLLPRLNSGLRTILRRSPRPILIVSGVVSPLCRALLAYDGSPKADEALFVAAYLARRWSMSLVVLTVPEKERVNEQTLAQAADYLASHDVEATFLLSDGPVVDAVMRTAVEQQCDWLLMGGYGPNPVVEAVIGSSLEGVLRQADIPVLICK
jgi:nucleotide-binding universal stress UspA family protein